MTGATDGGDSKAGLTLSGGGFRATLFHLGALWRLNELGLLGSLHRVVGVSGGSITAAMLGWRWRALEFDDAGVATNFESKIATPLRDLCRRRLDLWPGICGLAGALVGLRNRSIARALRRHLFGRSTLADLPSAGSGPDIVISAASLQTGGLVGLSNRGIEAEGIGRAARTSTPLALAVAASAAYPPALSSIVIRLRPSDWRPFPEPTASPLFNRTTLRRRLVLVDGGVIDNLGVEHLKPGFHTILVSDAGAPPAQRPRPSNQLLPLGWRALDISYSQAQILRRRHLQERDVDDASSQVVYWGLSDRIDDFALGNAAAMDMDETRDLARVGTRLSDRGPARSAQLINWGYALADAAMRKRLCTSAPAPERWPCPEHGFMPL